MSYPPTSDSALFAAAQRGEVESIRSLIAGGARPNAIEPASGWSALAAALLSGHARAAEALLDAGAEADLVMADGATAMSRERSRLQLLFR